MVGFCYSAANEQVAMNQYNSTSIITLLSYQHSLCFKSAVGHSKTTNMERNPTEILSCWTVLLLFPKSIFPHKHSL